jgi:hypothetical protein
LCDKRRTRRINILDKTNLFFVGFFFFFFGDIVAVAVVLLLSTEKIQFFSIFQSSSAKSSQDILMARSISPRPFKRSLPSFYLLSRYFSLPLVSY